MTLDFQQVRQQVRQLGEQAPQREKQLEERRDLAKALLKSHADNLEGLRKKAAVALRSDPALHCALPVSEALNAAFPQPALPERASVLAADGSQIALDRHAEVEYCLVNVGAIQACYGASAAPSTRVVSRLLYGDDLYTSIGKITSATLALRRDLGERTILAELAAQAEPPVITFTDGLLEIWGAREEGDGEPSEFQKTLVEYLSVLERMQQLQAVTAGYVDKPGTDLVVRLLEVAIIPEDELVEIRDRHPLRGIQDIDLYEELLAPGERSAVFAVQSLSAKAYSGALALHFFYLNVGRTGRAWVARVEIPAWVAESPSSLDNLQAVLVHQTRMLGADPYPYLLHRAHETAVVSLDEKDQVTQMIALELRRRGVFVRGKSHKQDAKDLQSRTRL